MCSCTVTSVQFVLAYSTNIHRCTNKPVFKALAVTLQVGNWIFKILLGRRTRDGRTDKGLTDGRSQSWSRLASQCLKNSKLMLNELNQQNYNHYHSVELRWITSESWSILCNFLLFLSVLCEYKHLHFQSDFVSFPSHRIHEFNFVLNHLLTY